VLLAFDTASATLSVAVLEDDEVRAELVSTEPMRHGEQLAPLVEEALVRAGATRRDVTAIGVGAGPGPYTGMRVGLVTARTLGAVLDVPVYAVCSLDVLAVEAVDTGAVTGPFVVATDARRKEVFWAAYDEHGTRTSELVVAKPDTLATDAPVVGEGALLYPADFPHAVGPARVSAAWLGHTLAGERAELLDPDPLYLRRPDAEVPGTPKPVS